MSFALHLEAVNITCIVHLLVRRVVALQHRRTFVVRHSQCLIAPMALAFHARIAAETLIAKPDRTEETIERRGYEFLSATFLLIWCIYTVYLVRAMVRGIFLLWRESQCVRGAPRIEARR